MFECYIRSLNTTTMYRCTKIYISIRSSKQTQTKKETTDNRLT